MLAKGSSAFAFGVKETLHVHSPFSHIGMALHDKAKKLLKLREYDMCLPLLIEADHCFSRCTDGILGRVDNVALCHLDIAWSYLSLRCWKMERGRFGRDEHTIFFLNRGTFSFSILSFPAVTSPIFRTPKNDWISASGAFSRVTVCASSWCRWWAWSVGGDRCGCPNCGWR